MSEGGLSMTRKEYMSALSQALADLSPEARESALTFYDEMMEDLMEEGKSECILQAIHPGKYLQWPH